MQVDQHKTSRRVWAKRLARALAAGVLGLGALAGAPAFAQSEGAPPGATPVEIEQWHGLRRVDAGVASAPSAEPAAPAELMPAPGATGTPTLAEALRPLAGLVGEKGAPLTVILGGYNVHQTKDDQATPHPEQAAARAAPVQPAVGPAHPEGAGRGQAPELLPVSVRSAAEQPAPPPIIVVPAVAAPAAPAAQGTSRGLFGSSLIQMTGVFGASLLGPLVLVALLCLLLRRHGKRSGTLFRIELVANQAPPTGYWVPAQPPAAAPAPAASANPPAEQADAPEVEETGERFELGPTYEDELRQREGQARQQEEAVLRQLFEDNVRLRDQLAQEPKAIRQ